MRCYLNLLYFNFLLFNWRYYTMIRVLYQVSSRRNSSPTLEVGVFLLKEDKSPFSADFSSYY